MKEKNLVNFSLSGEKLHTMINFFTLFSPVDKENALKKLTVYFQPFDNAESVAPMI